MENKGQPSLRNWCMVWELKVKSGKEYKEECAWQRNNMYKSPK